MTSRQAGPDGSLDMGYGFEMDVRNAPDGRIFGHGGGAPGMNGELRVYSDADAVVTILANLVLRRATGCPATGARRHYRRSLGVQIWGIFVRSTGVPVPSPVGGGLRGELRR
jgi:hypothetical protein